MFFLVNPMLQLLLIWWLFYGWVLWSRSQNDICVYLVALMYRFDMVPTIAVSKQWRDKLTSQFHILPPFLQENFDRPIRPKPKSAGRLASSIDKCQSLVQPLRSAPSIPSIHGTYGCRSPRQPRHHPFSGEHDRSAHKHLNPQEYINKGQCCSDPWKTSMLLRLKYSVAATLADWL